MQGLLDLLRLPAGGLAQPGPGGARFVRGEQRGGFLDGGEVPAVAVAVGEQHVQVLSRLVIRAGQIQFAGDLGQPGLECGRQAPVPFDDAVPAVGCLCYQQRNPDSGLGDRCAELGVQVQVGPDVPGMGSQLRDRDQHSRRFRWQEQPASLDPESSAAGVSAAAGDASDVVSGMTYVVLSHDGSPYWWDGPGRSVSMAPRPGWHVRRRGCSRGTATHGVGRVERRAVEGDGQRGVLGGGLGADLDQQPGAVGGLADAHGGVARLDAGHGQAERASRWPRSRCRGRASADVRRGRGSARCRRSVPSPGSVLVRSAWMSFSAAVSL